MALNQVPQPGQDLQPTQAPILANFATINAAFLVDHVEYALANQGLHNKITMPVQAAHPATVANQLGLYNFGNALYFKNPNSPAGVAGINFTTANHVANMGWCMLPSGTIFAWGLSNIPTHATVIINTAAIFTNTILNVQLSMTHAAAALSTPFLLAQAAHTFNVYNPNAVDVIANWFAVGY